MNIKKCGKERFERRGKKQTKRVPPTNKGGKNPRERTQEQMKKFDWKVRGQILRKCYIGNRNEEDRE